MKSCILRWAGGQVGVPYPGPQSAASDFLPPGSGDPGHQAQLGWALPSSLTQSQKLWIGLRWGLKNTVGFKQGHSPYPRIHPSPQAGRLSFSLLSPPANHFFIFSITLSSNFHPDFCLPHTPPLLASLSPQAGPPGLRPRPRPP